MTTTLLIDTSVAIHQLHAVMAQAGLGKEEYQQCLKAQLSWMMSGKWMSELIDDSPNVILAIDSKPYWRTEHLLRPEVYEPIAERHQSLLSPRSRKKVKVEPIHYKGGRKFPEYSFTRLKEQVYKTASEQHWTMLGVHGYEADDIIASLVMVNRMLDQPNDIWIVTVDSDQLGLVGDFTKWFCMYGWEPRVRANLDDVNRWSEKRLKASVERPEDIWTIKTVQGDKSDNLPPGTPIEVISLTEPPIEKRLWLQRDYRAVFEHVLTTKQNNSIGNPDLAVNWLRQYGIPRFIKPYVAEQQHKETL